jgi:hypothetical protein
MRFPQFAMHRAITMLMTSLKQNLSLLNLVDPKSSQSDDRLLPAVDQLSDPPLTKLLAELLRNPTSWCMGKLGVPPVHNRNIWVTYWFLPQPSHDPVDPASAIHFHLDLFSGVDHQLLDLPSMDSQAIHYLAGLGMSLDRLAVDELSRRDDQRCRLVREIQRVQCPDEAGIVSYGTEVDFANILEIPDEFGDVCNRMAYAPVAGHVVLWVLEAGGDDEMGEGNRDGMLAYFMSSHINSHLEAFHNGDLSRDLRAELVFDLPSVWLRKSIQSSSTSKALRARKSY